ncbi:hypothetical protein A9Q78_11435 [Methylophaga sp. 41_12_T18]|nr:hypothetical protein A9Q78_11435 [Methylophaga sp. 41_12_T18]
MIIEMKKPLISQSGQAMTEFVVSVAYVFLGLFVIVPMFGKLMDLQFQNQQASRYVAWERTVWFDQGDTPDESEISAEYWESVATRDDDELMNSVENRFFYGSGTGTLKPISIDDIDGVAGDTSPIWTYMQSKNTMYGGTTLSDGEDPETGKNTSLDAQNTPSVAYGVIDVIDAGMETIASPINFMLGALGGDNDDFLTFGQERRNYFSPVLTTQLAVGNSHGGGVGVWDKEANGDWGSGIEDALFQNWDGRLVARSAILADGWNTQSLEHYQQRSDDFVPSTMFDNDLFDAVIEVASLLDGAIGSLEFGAVGIEPMPAEDGEPLEVSCDDGFCYYDD